MEAYTRLAGIYDEIVVDPCYERWASYLHDLWLGDDQGVSDVLDVCCGTGLLAAELIARRFRVVGVDASEAMLDRARRRLGPTARLYRVALPELQVEGVFDAAVSTFDSLNYLPPSDLRLTLAALARHLRPGGWLVFDLHTDTMMDFTVSNPVVAGEADGSRFVISTVVDPVTRACETTIDLTPAGGAEPFSELHRQYFHGDADVHSALASAGFEVTAVTDEYSSRPADDSTLRATWVARRCPR